MNHKKKVSAVILAAGKGTRMKSEKPKVAVELNGKPMIGYVIESLQSSGIEDIVVVVGYKKEDVMDICKIYDGIRFVEQKEQLGTAHALMCAEELLGDLEGTVLVAAGDAPLITSESFSSLQNFHHDNNLDITILSANLDNATGYGRILRNTQGHVSGIVEEKDATDDQKKITEINTGTYCFSSPAVFDHLKKIGNSNAQKEYYLPDLVEIYNNEKLPVGALVLANSFESHGINSQEELARIAAMMQDGKLPV